MAEIFNTWTDLSGRLPLWGIRASTSAVGYCSREIIYRAVRDTWDTRDTEAVASTTEGVVYIVVTVTKAM